MGGLAAGRKQDDVDADILAIGCVVLPDAFDRRRNAFEAAFVDGIAETSRPRAPLDFDEGDKAGRAIAEKAGDSFVTVERLLLALAIEKDNEAGKVLAKAGVTSIIWATATAGGMPLSITWSDTPRFDPSAVRALRDTSVATDPG